MNSYSIISKDFGFDVDYMKRNRSLPPAFKLTRDRFPRYKLTHGAIM